jgi:L-asparagine oxygenase
MMPATEVQSLRNRSVLENSASSQIGQIQTITLDDDTQKRLRTAYCQADMPGDIEGRLSALLSTISILPPSVLSLLRALRHGNAHHNALIIENWPREEGEDTLPISQVMCANNSSTSWLSAAALLTVAQWLGEPFAYQEEKQGQLIHDIVPLPEYERSLSNAGSTAELLPHTEIAFLDFRPDFLLLYGVRNSDAPTTVVSATTLCRYLDPVTLAILRSPTYQFRSPQSFDSGLGKEQWSASRPIIEGPDEFPEICLNLNGTRPLTSAAARALKTVYQALEHPGIVQQVHLNPGSMVILDNRRVLHGRRPFTPRYDGHDRWLRRCYVRLNLWSGRTAACSSLRVFAGSLLGLNHSSSHRGS